MAEERLNRRLSAILAADVVGYSRLMARDEAQTHAILKELRSEVFEPATARYSGRIFKTTGDGTLVEYHSAVDAVLSAVEMQQSLAARNAGAPTEWQVELRIGISLGDVIVEGDDLFGNGVNIAARLEALAEPGTICVSGNVRDQVLATAKFQFEDLGQQLVKNIEMPIPVYLLSPAAGPAVRTIKTRVPTGRQRWTGAILVGGVALLAAAVATSWWQLWQPTVEPASLEQMAFPLPEKPSVAVLPFENLSGDATQGYFADGVSESIITTLSRIPNMFVIDRMSTFTFKGKPVKVLQVAEELGVRYVLEGSVQKSSDRLRVSAQLIDALSGHHLWAERYDGGIEDIFALQDHISRGIVTALQIELTEGEQVRVWREQTNDTEAYEQYLQGLEHWRSLTAQGVSEARRLFENAVALDPGFAAAWVELARTHYLAARFGWSDDPARSTAVAEELAHKAVAMDDTQADAYAMLSNVAILKGQHQDAVADCEKALTLNPKSEAMAHCARNLVFVDRLDDSLLLIRKAMRLSPYYPAWYACVLGSVHRQMGNYDEALLALHECRERLPESPVVDAGLAVVYVLAGRDDEARATMEILLKHSPRYSVAQFAKAQFYRDPRNTERLIAAVRKAGLPE